MDMLSIIALALLAFIVLKADWLARRTRVPVALELLENDMPVTKIETKTGRTKQLRVVGKNDRGETVKLDDLTSVDTDDPNIATIKPNGFGVVQVTGYSPGTTKVHISADADLGEETRAISRSFDVLVLPDEAVDIELEEIPEAAA